MKNGLSTFGLAATLTLTNCVEKPTMVQPKTANHKEIPAQEVIAANETVNQSCATSDTVASVQGEIGRVVAESGTRVMSRYEFLVVMTGDRELDLELCKILNKEGRAELDRLNKLFDQEWENFHAQNMRKWQELKDKNSSHEELQAWSDRETELQIEYFGKRKKAKKALLDNPAYIQ